MEMGHTDGNPHLDFQRRWQVALDFTSVKCLPEINALCDCLLLSREGDRVVWNYAKSI